jgi:hypothetical protein
MKTTNVKHQNYLSQQTRGLLRKIKLIQLKGGKCKCGYNTNYAALEFHHIDPNLKKFNIDLRACSNNSWSKLVAEVSKCQLLCSNCHREIEHPECVFLSTLL